MEQLDGIFRMAGNGLIMLAAVIGTVSVILHLRVPWWRSEMGVHLLCYMAVMAAVLDLSTIKILFGDTAGFALLRLIVFIGVPLVMAWRLWLQIKAQRRPDHLRKV